MTPSFSIIAWAGDDSLHLGELIDHVRIVGYGRTLDIIACGPAHAGPDAAVRPGVRRAAAAAGRAAGYNAGAALAFGDILVFVEAGTRLPARAFDLLGACLAGGRAGGGAFAVEAAGAGLAARLLVRTRSALSRLAGRPLRDQALFMRRDLFARLGGFRPDSAAAELELLRAARRAGAGVRVLRARVRVPGEIYAGPGGTALAWGELLLVGRDLLGLRPGAWAAPEGGAKEPGKGKST